MKTNLLYFAFVAVIVLFASLLNMLGGTKLRFNLGLYHGIDAAGKFYKGLFHKCAHGPQSWAWWQMFSLKYYPVLGVAMPSTGHRWWCYTRWGSLHFDVVFDRREQYA